VELNLKRQRENSRGIKNKIRVEPALTGVDNPAGIKKIKLPFRQVYGAKIKPKPPIKMSNQEIEETNRIQDEAYEKKKHKKAHAKELKDKKRSAAAANATTVVKRRKSKHQQAAGNFFENTKKYY